MKRPWRLATRLSLSFTLLFVVTFVATSVITIYAANKAFERAMDRDLEGLAQTVDSRINEGGDSPSSVVEDLSSAVRYMEIRDAAGRTLWRSTNLGTQRLPMRQPTTPGQNIEFRTGRLNKSSLRVILYPLITNGETTGYVVAGSLEPEFQDLLLNLIPAVGFAGLSGLAIAVGGTLWLSGRAARPLTELASRVNAAAAGGFTEELAPPISGSAEARQLGLAFQELIDRQRQEIQRERAFFADSSHVLRTPLAVLSGNVELLEDGTSEEERRDILTRVRASIDSMARTVSGLLLLAREQEQPGVTWEAISLSDLLTALTREAQVATRALHFSVDVADELVLAGDRQQLRDLFSTVIENSCRYTPADGSVMVHAVADGLGNACVEIADTGIGVTDEEAHRAPERFFRGSRARRLDPSGSGLGLSIAERIVRLHHGALAITPRQPAGTLVSISLPLLG